MSRTPICLALHGLGGTPEELRLPLAAIRAAGVTTEAPLLPGHGSTEAAYLTSCYADWRALALERYRALCARGPVLLLGYSLGGLLALEAVRRAVLGGLPEPVGLIVLSTPLSFAVSSREAGLFFRMLPLLARLPLPAGLFPVLRCPPRSASKPPAARSPPPTAGAPPATRASTWRWRRAWRARRSPTPASAFATAWPTRSAASREDAPWRGFETCLHLRHVLEMERAAQRLRPWLPRCRMPLLFMQLRHDDRCPSANAAQWLEKWGGSACAEVLAARSRHGGHLVPVHVESRDRVAARAADFARSAFGLATLDGHR